MKTLLTSVSAAFLAVALSPAAQASCRSDGEQLGREAAQSFCQRWENMYYSDTIIYPYAMRSQLCERHMIQACKQAMADEARDNWSTCTELIRSNWYNNQGKSAREAWAEWQRDNCLISLP